MSGAYSSDQADAARPPLDERRAYTPRSRQESFIVPLLERAISGAIAEHVRTRGMLALDVGCGGQPFRAALERAGCVYVSMDTQAQPGVSTDFLCAIDRSLPEELLARGPFSFILCTEVLEHVADWHAAFTNFATLLAPGGTLLITCPHVYPLHEEPYDFWRPTPHALRAFADRHHFDVVELQRLGTAWDVLGTILAASAPAPATRGPLAFLAAAVARPIRSIAIATLKLGVLQRMVRPKGSVYLSNLAVLRQHAAGVESSP